MHAFAQPLADPGSTTGHYQIVLNPSRPHDTFLLDTTTGTVWIQQQWRGLKDKPRFWDDPRIASTMLEWMLGCGSTCR
jgi:hypothetical protein